MAIAKREIGVVEDPKNSNTGARVREYQRSTNLSGTGWPYCAAFVCWCVQQWGEDFQVLDALKMNPGQFEGWRPKTAAAYGFDDWAERNGLLVINENTHPGEATLHTGDIVNYDFSHVGLLDTDKGNILYTVEGNTDSHGSAEGGGVYAKTRARSLARRVIRLLA